MLDINKTKIEVRYQETDQMGVVYHANYLVWFEIGRSKYIDQLGFNYVEMEKDNIVYHVIDLQISYKRTATYGDTLLILKLIDSYTGIKTSYGYRIENEQGETLVTGQSEQVIVDKDTFKPLQLSKTNP